MTRNNKNRASRALLLSALSLTLTACGSNWDEIKSSISGENSINYKSVVRSDPLSIPPDLTQAASDPRFKAPGGSATYSQYAQQNAGTQTVDSAMQVAVLPQRPDMRIDRDGDMRWISIDMQPDQVFSKVADFWTDNGFTLESVNPKAGLMTTNWAENRAKIPESLIRSMLSAVLETLYDSGTRDKFSTRIERAGKRTEIYISHRHMVEKQIGSYLDANIKWDNGREDPGLNAAMLARLMVYLGEDVDGARKKMAQAVPTPQTPNVTPVANKTALVVADTFDRAWRRVSVALDSGGFTVEDRDRSAGDFFVRYVDVDTGAKREEPNIFQRILGAKDPSIAPSYRLHLTQQGAQTELTIFDANGQRDTSPTAQRMLAVLADKI
jgi:outer membrane protein assembly factor BamC